MKYLYHLLALLLLFGSCTKEPDEIENPGKITTKDPTNVTFFDAVINGELADFKDGQIFECGFVWSLYPAPTTDSSNKVYYGPVVAPKTLSHSLAGLEPGTRYYYRVFAILSSGINYGNEVSFSTPVNPWTFSSEFPGEGKAFAPTFSIGSNAYVCIGHHYPDTMLTDLWEYNAAGNIWTRKAEYPGKTIMYAVGFSLGGNGYITTGRVGYNETASETWEYFPSLDKWNRKADYPEPGIFRAVSFVIDNKAYVGTGANINGAVKSFYEYDSRFDRWTKKADFPYEVQSAVGFSISGKGYVASGYTKTGESNKLWEYDPVLDCWILRKNLPIRSGEGIGFSLGGKGFVGLGSNDDDDFYVYDQYNDNWSKFADYRGLGRGGENAFVINDTAYVGMGFMYIDNVMTYYKGYWKISPE
jgi:N-acetylneuraminic acid mutarotase